MTVRINTTIGDLIAEFYGMFLDTYADEEIAAASTAVMIHRILERETHED